jgi:methionyl-tRNA synthetase
VDYFGKLRIREAMSTAMEVSDLANKFIQSSAIWDKNIDQALLANKLYILLNIIRFVGLLMEPFTPTLSAKLYFILKLNLSPWDEALMATLNAEQSSRALLKLVPSGHEINLPVPLVSQSILKS